NVNERGDDYGGELANRLRFGIRVLEAVRERVGRKFIVGIRVTGDDFLDRGLNHAQMQEICGRLAELKLIDYFNVIGGSAETFVGEGRGGPKIGFKAGVY